MYNNKNIIIMNRLFLYQVYGYNCIMKKIIIATISEKYVDDSSTDDERKEFRKFTDDLRNSFKDYAESINEKISSTSIYVIEITIDEPFIIK